MFIMIIFQIYVRSNINFNKVKSGKCICFLILVNYVESLLLDGRGALFPAQGGTTKHICLKT